ncbi:MAG TPA: caspase family protein [Anaerolineae bacterium]|nr:caspase family protein [Anaerolineae bacterium]
MTQSTVFISFSHKDEPWKDRLVTHLGVLQRQGLLDLWDDRRIGAGDDWRREIRQAMDRARVAVLLVSADFLTSDFILGEEVPRLLQRRDEEGLRVFPVIVRPCAWQRVEWLARMQARPRDGRPLSAGDEHQVDVDLATIAEEIAELVEGERAVPSPDDGGQRLEAVKAVKAAGPSPAGVTDRGDGSNFHALLIGVGDYLHPRFVDLPATVRDAQALAGILTDPARCGYPPDNVRTITGPDATGANIHAALERLATSATPEATAFVYFSGHGGRTLPPSPDFGRGAGGEGWRAYLCPREADPDDLPTTAISGAAFSTMLAAIPARRLLVMLDACHAAGSATLVRKATDGTPAWKAGLPESYYEALSRGSGRVVIASSKEDQFSRVRPQGDLSLFTYHLREALEGQAAVRGDGLIHVLDVFHHINEAVQANEPEQTPILKVDDLDLNFPIAVAPAQAAEILKTSEVARDIAAIREQIVREPIAGAQALSAYLAGHPELAVRRNEVDLKRSELERIQHDLDLFGPDPGAKAAKNRAVFFLLRTCMEMEGTGHG